MRFNSSLTLNHSNLLTWLWRTNSFQYFYLNVNLITPLFGVGVRNMKYYSAWQKPHLVLRGYMSTQSMHYRLVKLGTSSQNSISLKYLYINSVVYSRNKFNAPRVQASPNLTFLVVLQCTLKSLLSNYSLCFSKTYFYLRYMITTPIFFKTWGLGMTTKRSLASSVKLSDSGLKYL